MDIKTLSSWLWNISICFCMYGHSKFCFYFPICSVNFFLVFFMNSEWNESCTERISCIQVNSSIIEDQSGVSVFFAATASTWAPSSGWLWKALQWSFFRLLPVTMVVTKRTAQKTNKNKKTEGTLEQVLTSKISNPTLKVLVILITQWMSVMIFKLNVSLIKVWF